MSTNSGKAGGWRRAALVIMTGVAVALAGWATTRMLGVELTVDKGGNRDSVDAVDVTVAAVVAGLAAWGTFALLARRGMLRWWPFVGSTALAVSMVGPSYQADGAAAIALISLHLVVGAALIAGFGLQQRRECHPTEERAKAGVG